jgi:hypothetical protein
MVPYVFPILFVGMWIFVSKLLSYMGGWNSLSEYYKSEEQFSGKKWYFQSLKVGWVNYNSCITLGVSETSIFLSVLPLFRIGHPTLSIPLQEFHGSEHRGLILSYVDINPEKGMGRTIRLFKKQADRIEHFTRNAWHYERLS